MRRRAIRVRAAGKTGEIFPRAAVVSVLCPGRAKATQNGEFLRFESSSRPARPVCLPAFLFEVAIILRPLQTGSSERQMVSRFSSFDNEG